MIKQEKMQEIIDKTDIVELVRSEGITLEKVGKNYRGLCPFHDDKTPSFYVNQEKKIAHCMTCKGGGNPITFIKMMHNLTIDEAALYLAKKLDIELDIKAPVKKESIYLKHYNVMQKAQDFYEYYLNNTVKGKEALKYLYNRKLTDETIKKFGIGLSPAKSDILYKTLTTEQDCTMELVETGLIKNNQTSFYDMFTNRIMFPIKDEFGKTIAFSGRIFDEESNSKYINSPETVIFHKSNVLYNLHNAKDQARKSKRLILFEGFMDVIAAYNAGIKDGICSMGTSLTVDQALIISKYVNNVIICYDGDNAGIEATNRAIDILSSKGLRIGIVSLKDNLDPDEYASKYGYQALADCFENDVLDILGFKYYYYKRNVHFTNYLELEEFKNTIFKLIEKTNSNVLIEKYIYQLSYDLDVSFEAIKNDYNNYFNLNRREKRVENKKTYKKSNIKIDNKYCLAEYILLHYMIKSKEMAYYIEACFQDVVGDLSVDPLSLEIRILLVQDYFQNHDYFDYQDFKYMLSDDLRMFFEAKVLTVQDCDDDKTETEIKDCLSIIKELDRITRIKELEVKAKTASQEEKIKIYQEILNLKNKAKVV